MATLDDKIQKQIDSLSEKAYNMFELGNYNYCLNLHEQAWSMYPEPKNKWNEAYNTARYAADDCFSQLDLENVKKWLDRMIYVNENLHQSDDELMYYVGKYKFEIKDYEDAFTAFRIVVKIAGMRYFEDEPSKYLDFYTHSEKFIKKDGKNIE